MNLIGGAPAAGGANKTSPGSERVCFVSITTKSHWPGTNLTLRGVMENTSGVSAAVLLIDGDRGELADSGSIRVLHPAQCVPRPVFESMRRRYTPGELCFACKPYVMRALFDEGWEQVHYLDGDMGIYGDLSPLIDALAHHDLLLTPHYLTPVPEDGKQPRALTLLRAGVFNGGYVGVRNTAEGRRFSDWWGEAVARHGYNDPWAGMCGDQRWLDLVPAVFPGAGILRHPGANVAYWNLHERSLRLEDGCLMANSAPLLFFHFSGFDPRQRSVLSRFQNRIDASAHPVLTRLLSDYADALLSMGYDGYRKLGYEHARWWHRNTLPIRLVRHWYFRVREGLI